MATTIKITPPGGTQRILKSYNSCSVSLSSSDRSGSFALSFSGVDSGLVDFFPVGSDVQIEQDGHLFRGWVLNPVKGLDSTIRLFNMDGPDYTAKTQKIIVTESYINVAVDEIVQDLISIYVPWATATKVDACPKIITIKFPDQFLWDSMETLCKITGYEWYIDEQLVVNFFEPITRINPNVLSQANSNYKRGTASLKPDASKLVNKLWVKGSKGLSDDFTQAITVVANIPIPLYYKPRATVDGVTVTIGGVPRSVGIQNIDQPGTKDFLLNFNEKLLVPDRVTSGSGSVVYKYEYPIKILLEEPASQGQYGIFEDVYKVETDDKGLALELGMRYLAKYSQPIIMGSIEPFHGVYKPGELVQVDLPDLNVSAALQIKQVTYDSAPLTPVTRKLQLESPDRDLPNILKDMHTRLRLLEKEVYQDSDGPVERYVAKSEFWGWSETVSYAVYACSVPSTTLYPSETLYPC